MQKISLYLLKNRITVSTDSTGFTTELRTVYTRKLKLYRGIDNTIEFDVRNSESRKESIVGKTPRVILFDTEQQKLLEKTGELVYGTTHLFKITFSKEELNQIDKQILTLAAYLDSEAGQEIIYGGAQFDMHVSVDLLDGTIDRTDFIPEYEIKIFNRVYSFVAQAGEYVSELAAFAPKINDDSTFSTVISIHPGAFRGLVTIEGTTDVSTASSNFWTTAATINIVDGATQTITLSGPYTYIRARFPENSTGIIDKITVRN
jgi:hypothetical protein